VCGRYRQVERKLIVELKRMVQTGIKFEYIGGFLERDIGGSIGGAGNYRLYEWKRMHSIVVI